VRRTPRLKDPGNEEAGIFLAFEYVKASVDNTTSFEKSHPFSVY